MSERCVPGRTGGDADEPTSGKERVRGVLCHCRAAAGAVGTCRLEDRVWITATTATSQDG